MYSPIVTSVGFVGPTVMLCGKVKQRCQYRIKFNTEVKIHIGVFWVMTPYDLVCMYKYLD